MQSLDRGDARHLWHLGCISGDRGTTNLMEVMARFVDGVKFEVEARGHKIICDQPAANGGTDAGMTPPEFLLASLATCAAYYAAQYLKARQLSTDDLKVRVSAEKVQQPARLGSFRIDIIAPGLDERHQVGVIRAAKACLIHNTLLGQPRIDIVLNAPRYNQERDVA